MIYKKIVFLLALFFAVTAKADTWTSLAQDFLDYNPELAQLKADADINHQKVYEAYAMAAPTISYNFLGTYQDRPAPFAGFGAFSGLIFPPEAFRNELEASWAVYAGGRILGTLKQNQIAKKVSRLNYQQAKNQGLFQVFRLAVQIFDVSEQLKILKLSEETQKKYLDLVLKKQKTGNVTPYEVNQARADFYSYLPRLINLQTQMTQLQIEAQKNLGRSMSLEPSMFSMSSKGDLEKFKSLLNEAMNTRPDLAVNQLQAQSVDINRDLLFSTHRPLVTLSAAFGYQTQDFDDIWDSQFLGHAVNVNFRWKLFEGGALYPRLKISALQKVAFDKNRQSLLDAIKADLQKNYEMGQSLSRLFRETQKWQDQTELALTKGQKSYQIGKVSQIEWLQLQKGDEAARLALLNVKSQLLTHEIERQFLIGRDLLAWAKRK
jgi:outer membrane protein TolC